MRRLLAFLLVWAVLAGAPVSAAELLEYEPVVVRLSGVIVIEAFYGPPGYGEDPENDSIERAAILVLDKPVAVRTEPDDIMDSDSAGDVRRIQLIIRDPKISAKTWRHVVIEGRLFRAETGHHHTHVLMSVARLVSSP